jgi:hypothetical protein
MIAAYRSRMTTHRAFLILLATLSIVRCGGGSGTTTTPTPPTTTPPAGAVLQIHTRVAALRVGETENASANLSGGTTDLTGVAELTSSDASVFVVEGNRVIRGVGPGRATLRGSYQGLTAEIPQMVVAIGNTPNRTDSLPNPAVLINEFRTSGPSGERDEFIELRNVRVGRRPGRWSIALVTGTGHRESLGVILAGDSVVNAGCHFLLVGVSGPNAYSSGSQALGDFRWASSFFVDEVSFALLNPAGQIVDQVGIGQTAVYREGEPLLPRVGRSHERVGDSNNNAVDFQPSAADSPRGRQSPCS